MDKVIWSDGKCAKCSMLEKSPIELQNSFFNRRTPLSGKTKLKSKVKVDPEKRRFFQEIAVKNKDLPVSFESGNNLGELKSVNMAHIFPKEIYKSLAYNHDNIILLSWAEHTRFDELLGAHDFEKLEEEFKSWSRICERILILLPLCEEQGNLRTALEEYLS